MVRYGGGNWWMVVVLCDGVLVFGVCVGVCWCVLVNASVCWCGLVYVGVCVGVCWCVLVCVDVC